MGSRLHIRRRRGWHLDHADLGGDDGANLLFELKTYTGFIQQLSIEVISQYMRNEDEIRTHDPSLHGKYAGTDQDDRDMRVLGKRQVLNVGRFEFEAALVLLMN